MVYRHFKVLRRSSLSDKVLHDEAFNIARNGKYDGYNSELASVVCNVFLAKNLLLVLLKVKLCQTKN